MATAMIGEKLWLASVSGDGDGSVREIKPMVRRVRLCDSDHAVATFRVITVTGGKEMVVPQCNVHSGRKAAVQCAERMCADLDGQSLHGLLYKYVRPDADEPPTTQVRLRQVSPDRFAVELKLPGKRSFRAPRGLRRVPHWLAEKVAADVRAGRDVRGFFKFDMSAMQASPEFVRLDRRTRLSRPHGSV